jgi:hypothetical protein
VSKPDEFPAQRPRPGVIVRDDRVARDEVAAYQRDSPARSLEGPDLRGYLAAVLGIVEPAAGDDDGLYFLGPR